MTPKGGGDTPPEDECPRCSSDMTWFQCEECGGEIYVEHDCGEDTCCCADPEPNVECEDCHGRGGFYRCLACHPMSDAEAEARYG